MATLLEIDSVSKSFDGVRALRAVSFDLRAGEVHALVGENGAGKSTLIKVITGAHRPDSGSILLDGRPTAIDGPLRARGLGIAAIYQQPALFPDLTVAENIALGGERPGRWSPIRPGRRRARARELLGRVGASIDPDAEVRRLSMPEQQLVEIARALGADAQILILDEPTASLGDREVDNLFRVVRDLKASGVGLIYVSHRLEELPAIADRVTALRDGAVVGTRPMAEVGRDDLIRMMVGRPVESIFPKIPARIGRVALRAIGLGCRQGGVHGIDLELREGEILGLAGLVGAGRTELARVFFGMTPADSGEIRIHGALARIDGPARAIGFGIALVPEDRRRQGVIAEMSVAANITLASLPAVSNAGLLDFAREGAFAGDRARQLGVKAGSIDNLVATLSGGNQQKVALARWLATSPTILILDEPTQGVDVGAKAEIHRIIGELAARGMAILLISSELPEILGMSDRVAVMHGGTIVGVLDRAEATEPAILDLALGHRVAS